MQYVTPDKQKDIFNIYISDFHIWINLEICLFRRGFYVPRRSRVYCISEGDATVVILSEHVTSSPSTVTPPTRLKLCAQQHKYLFSRLTSNANAVKMY